MLDASCAREQMVKEMGDLPEPPSFPLVAKRKKQQQTAPACSAGPSEAPRSKQESLPGPHEPAEGTAVPRVQPDKPAEGAAAVRPSQEAAASQRDINQAEEGKEARGADKAEEATPATSAPAPAPLQQVAFCRSMQLGSMHACAAYTLS
jgi:hypothetical protein